MRDQQKTKYRPIANDQIEALRAKISLKKE